MAINYTHLNPIKDIGSGENGFEDKTQSRVVTEQLPANDQLLLAATASIALQHLQQERDRLSLLLEVNNAVVSTLNLHELLNAVSKSVRRLTRHQYASLCYTMLKPSVYRFTRWILLPPRAFSKKVYQFQSRMRLQDSP